MPTAPRDPIQYCPAKSQFVPGDTSDGADARRQHLLDPASVAALAPQLEDVRNRMERGSWPASWKELDTGFINLPAELLAERRSARSKSVVARIQQTGKRLEKQCDRVVLLGIGGSSMGTRALANAMLDPNHNELTRRERHRVPRLYIEGDNVDNDSLASLLELLGSRCGETSEATTRFGVIVISKSGGTLETAVAFRVLRDLAQKTYGKDSELYRQLVVAITERHPPGKPDQPSRLWKIAERDHLESVFEMPPAVGGRYSILTPVGLVPAATLGLDIVELLAGAADMTRTFFKEPAATNPVLQFVGVSHLGERDRGAKIRVLTSWTKRLEGVGLWYDQLLAESLGKNEHAGATPVTSVGTRDLHSRGQQHQEGRRDKLITNLRVGRMDRTPIEIGPSDQNDDNLDAIATKTLHDCMNAAADGTARAYWQAARPTADLVLPSITEYTLGQLFQMLMLATVVEGFLIDVNPFGQPGVQAYKQQMHEILYGPEPSGTG